MIIISESAGIAKQKQLHRSKASTAKQQRPLLYPGSSVVRRVAACRALSCSSVKKSKETQSKPPKQSKT